MTSAEVRQQHASFHTGFFPLSFFSCYYVVSVRQWWQNKQGKSMILPLKNYTRIGIYHSFKLKGSESVVWCWCLLLPGLYYYRRLSDQSFKACCFPFLFVPGITSNLVLPYHQPHYAQSFFRICRSFVKWADLLYTHISKYTITGQTEELWQYFYSGMRVFAFWTQNTVRKSSILIFSNNNK